MDAIAGYLFATFSGEGKEGEQIYYSLSEDGLFWKDLNERKPVLCSDTGRKGVRDPFLLRSRDGNRYYLIATDLKIASGISWEEAKTCGSRSIIIWESEDLVHWSDARSCMVGPEDAGCVWAPEAVYDRKRDAYMVFWASFTGGRHRIYRAYTRDFLAFTEPELYMERDYDVIDLTIVQSGGKYYRFYKNEIDKNICLDCGSDLDGEFQRIGSQRLAKLRGVEGPAAYPLKDGRWCLLVDRYAVNGGYMPVTCTDLTEGCFKEEARYDMGLLCKRHGSVLTLSEKEYKVLKQAFLQTGRK